MVCNCLANSVIALLSTIVIQRNIGIGEALEKPTMKDMI